jgi:hypothetical protein
MATQTQFGLAVEAFPAFCKNACFAVARLAIGTAVIRTLFLWQKHALQLFQG